VTIAIHSGRTVLPKTLERIISRRALPAKSFGSYYKRMREYTIILDPDPEGAGFTVTVPALPGCITEGRTREEAVDNAKEAILLFLESLLAEGSAPPEDTPQAEVLKVAV